MSAAAARRRKQLAARAAAGEGSSSSSPASEEDIIATKLKTLLEGSSDDAVAYEALQLAQSQVRKAVKLGQFSRACDLAYETGRVLMEDHAQVSVASQLKMLLVQVLKETHTEETDDWLTKLERLHEAHVAAMKKVATTADGEGSSKMTKQETNRLERLERDFLRRALGWSNDLGSVRFGSPRIQALLGQQCWDLPEGDEEEDRSMVMCEAVQHMCLAERPHRIVEWLQTLPKPTKAQWKMGHTCPPADVDSLLTRSLLLMCAVENLRDANTLLDEFLSKVETRSPGELTKSYMTKDDGKSPSHAVFGSMLIKICEKDARTGPLYTWLLKSFKRELDVMPEPQMVQSYTTTIGKIYFNIQPPPSMLSMMENMMEMMGTLRGPGGAPALNPAMMQAMMQGGQM